MSNAAYEVRSLHRLLEIHDDGDKLEEINTDLREVLSKVTEAAQGGTKAVGSLTVTLAFQGHAKGVDVAITHVTKVPKKQPAKSSYFVTETGDTLTTKNPHQREMFGGKAMSHTGQTTAG
ncbi:MAG TPA: hypothetical protein VEB20_10400 [Azospirillaceae bacterium]|nr:hypothetical protein [Azospirillaceae bacterium]